MPADEILRFAVALILLASSIAAAQTPSRLTTYLGAYGSAPPAYTGSTQIVQARAYNPGGAAAITYMEVDLKESVEDEDPVFSLCLFHDDGGYFLKIGSDTMAVPWPYLRLTPDGTTKTVNVTNESLQLTSYRLSQVGNELQLDLGITQSGSFNDQIALWAQTASAYSQPWVYSAAGQWDAASGSGSGPGSGSGIGSGPGTISALTAVWANNGEDKVTSDELRATNSKNVVNNSWNGQNVTIFGAQNEVVAFNLILEAGKQAASNVSVQLQSLTGPSGYTISSPPSAPSKIFTWADVSGKQNRNIELFYIRYLQMIGMSGGYYVDVCWHDERIIPEKLQSPYNTAPADCANYPWLWSTRPNADKYYPEIAVPLELYPNGFNITQAANQSIWVDVYIPKDAPSGSYTGSIAISENGTVTRQIPVALTVLAFSLPDEPSAKTMLFFDNHISQRLFNDEFPEPTDPNLPSIEAAYDKTRQLVHRHKISLIGDPLAGDVPSAEAASALTGSLFTAANGYSGPGAGTGENVYAFGMYSAPTHLAWTKAQWWYFTTAMEAWFEKNAPGVDRFIHLCDECDGKDLPYTPSLVNSWARIIKDTVNNPIGSKMKSFATIDFHNAIANEPDVDTYCAATFGYWNSYDSNGNFLANNIYSDEEIAEISGSLASKKETCTYNSTRIGAGGFETEDEGTDLREFPWAAYYKHVGRMFYWEASTFQGPGWENDLFNNVATWGGAKLTPLQATAVFFDDPYMGKVLASSATGGGSGNGDGVLLYPSYDATNTAPSWAPYNAVDEQYGVPKGVFASLRLKYWRRGIQDVDYLAEANAVNPLGTSQVLNCMLNAQHYSKPRVLWDFRYPWDKFPLGEIGGATTPLASWSADPDVWEGARMQLAKIIAGTASVYTCPN